MIWGGNSYLICGILCFMARFSHPHKRKFASTKAEDKHPKMAILITVIL